MINLINKKCNIWKITFRNVEKEYNLHNYISHDYNIILFNVDIMFNNKYCINNLNKYYGELCCMYYVWKNNLKSDIIGFDQYRRHWNKIYYNDINDNKIQVYESYTSNESLFTENTLGHFLYSFILYIKYYHNEYLNIIDDNLFNDIKTLNYINIFICKWEIFEKICNIIFGYLEYILPNEQWKDELKIQNYLNFNIKYHLNYKFDQSSIVCTNDTRQFPYLLEIINGLIQNTISKSFCKNNICYYVVYKCNNFNDYKNILKLYKFNIGNGIDYVLIKDDNHIFCNNYNKYNYNDYDYRKLNLYDNNDNFNNKFKTTNEIIEIIKTDKNNKEIKLKTNEYIYSKSSIELHNNNYIIKNI